MKAKVVYGLRSNWRYAAGHTVDVEPIPFKMLKPSYYFPDTPGNRFVVDTCFSGLHLAEMIYSSWGEGHKIPFSADVFRPYYEDNEQAVLLLKEDE